MGNDARGGENRTIGRKYAKGKKAQERALALVKALLLLEHINSFGENSEKIQVKWADGDEALLKLERINLIRKHSEQVQVKWDGDILEVSTTLVALLKLIKEVHPDKLEFGTTGENQKKLVRDSHKFVGDTITFLKKDINSTLLTHLPHPNCHTPRG
ncbi:hypothetical protein [Mastigocoleus testarum]|uniref:Uncharacterized protein n=1 Tax=Mastigocoleus testarum BC008 TaxID=371196 RepID=A0A0V7ZBM7_9CYAN|nr:hypothetical protein [Mastigocoleus testarum]KST61921.1 hypothetical protein BC008_07700 [Mastigocoleus testarum BC008]